MKIIQSKKHKLETYEFAKYHYLFLMIKDDGIHTMAYFHKKSVTICEEIQKSCDKNKEIEKDRDKKDCDKKEKIKKDCKKTSYQ